MKDNRMFLVEKGTFVVIRDGKKEVSFGSFEEFNKYYPNLDLTGKDYIDYEPGRGMFIDDSDDTISIKDAPIQEYEDVIDSIDTLIENKNDIYFDVTVDDAKKIKKEHFKLEEQNKLYETWPLYKQINAALGIYGEDIKQECITAIQSTIDIIDAKETDIDKEKIVKNIKKL